MDANDLSGGNSRPAAYRAKAEECRRRAQETMLSDVRRTYLELAAQWDDLARQVQTHG